MTAIVGFFGPAASEESARRALDAMRARGDGAHELWQAPGVVLAAARHAWEDGLSPGRATRLVEREGVVVVADAAIFYRDDLRRALRDRGVTLDDESPAACIAAAYQAWGADGVSRLEGDFAFALWDTRAGRALCARDFTGKRPLVVSDVAGSLLVASSVPGLLAHAAVPADIDVVALAEVAAGVMGASGRTGYRALRQLAAGTTLLRERDAAARLVRHWTPPRIAATDRRPFAEAAEELRELLAGAVRERLDPNAPNTVWMSGGWDSTAVFGAGRYALGGARGGDRLLPVSISYPPGDPGREDELIEAVSARWDARIQWLDIADIPLFDQPAERAARRDQPFAHTYEHWCRALARGTRAVGGHVAFDGVGGDQLFAVSQVYLADLFRAGRWLALAREWRAKGLAGSGKRAFYRWVVRPALPDALWRAAARLAGRELPSHVERPIPPWIDRDFARAHELANATPVLPAPRFAAPSARETHWYLANPYFPFVFGEVTAIALDEGVELRSPLYDRRIVEFAVRRPREERSSGTETKLLLRAAMRDLLPESVLAPRDTRTGVTAGYFRRVMSTAFPPIAAEVFAAPLLRELGIVDVERLHAAVERYGRTGDQNLGVLLTFTLQAELWARARRAGAASHANETGEDDLRIASGGQVGRASAGRRAR